MINSFDILKNSKNISDNKISEMSLQICKKIEGCTIYVQLIYENNIPKVKIMKKNYIELNIIDYLLSNFFTQIYQFFNDKKIIEKLNTKYIYQFVYVPNYYEKIPKNNLVLNGLFSSKSKQLIDYNLELFKYISNELNIEYNFPLIKFCDNLKLHNIHNENELFSFIEDLPTYNNSDKIFIITLKDIHNIKYTCKIDRTQIIKNHSNRDDISKLIYCDILQFVNKTFNNWEKIYLSSEDKNERYLELIYILFKVFFKTNFQRYENIYINRDKLFDKIIFQLNYDSISDNEVLEILRNYPNSSEIVLKYFILLFKNKKKNLDEFLTENNLILQNILFEKITKKLDKNEQK